MRLASFTVGDVLMTARMHKSIFIAAVSLGLMSAPLVSYARVTTVDDPGASAALGTIYFSSVLDDAGIGSGHSGGASAGGGLIGNSDQNPTGRSNAGGSVSPGAGSDPGAGFGETVSSHAPDSIASPPPSGRTQDIFGDITPDDSQDGVAPGGGSGPLTNFPAIDDIVDPTDYIEPYPPDKIVGLPSAVVSSVAILQVPEPASIALFGAGFAGIGLLVMRRARGAR